MINSENSGIYRDRYEGINRLLTSRTIRKMQEKSAMLPLNHGGFMRTQYSQSIEISVLSRVIAQRAFEKSKFDYISEKEKKDIYELISCAGIVRGIGQPPFGHLGDAAIREWFKENVDNITDKTSEKIILSEEMKNDLLSFSGVRRSVRVICRYTELKEMPYEIINILSNSVCQGFNKCIMISEADIKEDVIKKIKNNAVKPFLSFILEAAAYIVTVTSAIEDAAESKYVICRQLLQILRTEDEFDEDISNEEYQSYCDIVRYLDECYVESRLDLCNNDDIDAVHKWIVFLRDEMSRYAAECFADNYEDILDGTFTGDLINNSWCRTVKKVFTRSQRQLFAASGDFILTVNNSSRIVYLLVDKFIKAVVSVNKEDSLFSTHMRLYTLIPECFRKLYEKFSDGKSEQEKMYLKIIMVLDYICSLTDRKAENLYRKLCLEI